MKMSTCLTQNLILVAVFYQLLLVLGNPIFLGGFKMGDDDLDQS